MKTDVTPPEMPKQVALRGGSYPSAQITVRSRSRQNFEAHPEAQSGLPSAWCTNGPGGPFASHANATCAVKCHTLCEVQA